MGRPAANTGLEGAAVKQRNDWLDLWRSLAVLTMLVFHALWDLELFGVLPAGTMETPAADVPVDVWVSLFGAHRTSTVTTDSST